MFLGAKITADGRSEGDLRRRIALDKSAMMRLVNEDLERQRHLARDKETIIVRICVLDSFILLFFTPNFLLLSLHLGAVE